MKGPPTKYRATQLAEPEGGAAIRIKPNDIPVEIVPSMSALERIGFIAMKRFADTGILPTGYVPRLPMITKRGDWLTRRKAIGDLQRQAKKLVKNPEALMHYVKSIVTHRERLEMFVRMVQYVEGGNVVRDADLVADATPLYMQILTSHHLHDIASIAAIMGFNKRLTETLVENGYFRFNPVTEEGGSPAHYSLDMEFFSIPASDRRFPFPERRQRVARIGLRILSGDPATNDLEFYCASTALVNYAIQMQEGNNRQLPAIRRVLPHVPLLIFQRGEGQEPGWAFEIPAQNAVARYIGARQIMLAEYIGWISRFTCTPFGYPWNLDDNLVVPQGRDVYTKALTMVHTDPDYIIPMPGILQAGDFEDLVNIAARYRDILADFGLVLYSFLMEEKEEDQVMRDCRRLIAMPPATAGIDPIMQIPFVKGITYKEVISHKYPPGSYTRDGYHWTYGL